MEILAMIVYIITQIIFIPFTILGVVIVTFKQMVISKKLGISQTAIGVINGRWTMDRFGMRTDSAAVSLVKVLPNSSEVGLWMVLIPFYILYKISGKHKMYPVIAPKGEESFANIVMNRTVYFDGIIDKNIDDVDQFVLMGAGFDTRAYGSLKDKSLKIFELDMTATQSHKLKYLKAANIAADHVKYVQVDFARDNWYENLELAGYDPKKKTLFLWEGVTLYLSENDVRKTLSEMKNNSASGSVIAVDFYSKEFVEGKVVPGGKKSLDLLKITDEEFGFGIDLSTDYENNVSSFVESEGFKVGKTHFMGSKTKKGTWMAVAELNL